MKGDQYIQLHDAKIRKKSILLKSHFVAQNIATKGACHPGELPPWILFITVNFLSECNQINTTITLPSVRSTAPTNQNNVTKCNKLQRYFCYYSDALYLYQQTLQHHPMNDRNWDCCILWGLFDDDEGYFYPLCFYLIPEISTVQRILRGNKAVFYHNHHPISFYRLLIVVLCSYYAAIAVGYIITRASYAKTTKVDHFDGLLCTPSLCTFENSDTTIQCHDATLSTLYIYYVILFFDTCKCISVVDIMKYMSITVAHDLEII